MEGVAAAAATLQLAGQALTTLKKLIELYRRSRKAEETILEKMKRIERISDILKDIMQEPSLNSPSVNVVLDSCKNILIRLNGELKKLLDGFSRFAKWKVPHSVIAAMKEPQLEKLFESMDSHKSDLMLALQAEDSKVWFLCSNFDDHDYVHCEQS